MQMTNSLNKATPKIINSRSSSVLSSRNSSHVNENSVRASRNTSRINDSSIPASQAGVHTLTLATRQQLGAIFR